MDSFGDLTAGKQLFGSIVDFGISVYGVITLLFVVSRQEDFMCWMSVDLAPNTHNHHDSVLRLGRLSDKVV